MKVRPWLVVVLAIAMLTLGLTVAAVAEEDYEVEPNAVAPHYEPVVTSVILTRPNEYSQPTGFKFLAEAEHLGYDPGYGNCYNPGLWMNIRPTQVLATGANGVVKKAWFSSGLYPGNAGPYASDTTADYYRVEIRLAHTTSTGAQSTHKFYYDYKVLKPVPVGETCSCGAVVERNADGSIYAVGGDTNIETISDHMCYCGLAEYK